MNNPLWEGWENKEETVKTQWVPIWESYENNFEHISIQNKSKCQIFPGIQHAWVEGDRYCFRRWESYSAMGEVGQNSTVLATLTQPTVLLAACMKNVQVLRCSMYLLKLIVPIVIVLEEWS